MLILQSVRHQTTMVTWLDSLQGPTLWYSSTLNNVNYKCTCCKHVSRFVEKCCEFQYFDTSILTIFWRTLYTNEHCNYLQSLASLFPLRKGDICHLRKGNWQIVDIWQIIITPPHFFFYSYSGDINMSNLTYSSPIMKLSSPVTDNANKLDSSPNIIGKSAPTTRKLTFGFGIVTFSTNGLEFAVHNQQCC